MSYQPLWLRDLVAYSIQAAALVGVGVMMARALRLSLPRVRHAYWQALLAVCVFLPLLQPWRPEIGESTGAAFTNVSLRAAVASAPTGPSVAEIVLWLICAGIVLRIGWMALGLIRLWLYRRHAQRIEQIPEAVKEAQQLAPVCPGFFLSRQLPTPATFGFFGPAILFPSRFLEMEPAMQKAIALHELLHVERRDWLWNMFEEIVLTLLWFHLPLWWVVRNARLSREQVVDAEAVRRSNARRPYLKALLEMAGQKQLAESLPAPLFLREHQLAERVALMMKEVHMSRKRLTLSILTAAVTLLIAGATLAWAFPLKTPAPEPEPSAQASAPATPGSPDATDTALPENAVTAESEPGRKIVKVYKVGKNVSAPVPIYKPDPPYTTEARKHHLSGTVVLNCVIDAKGKVVEVKEHSKPLGQGLDESAVNTVRTWTFSPATRKGIPVPVREMVEITFVIYGKNGKGSQIQRPASDPPAQGTQRASADVNKNHKTYVNQAELQRQVDEALKQAKIAQQAASKIDQKKIQGEIDEAMKQGKIARDKFENIDQAKIQRQVEEAMKKAQIAQDAAPKIDQAKIQQQVEQAMKQLKMAEAVAPKIDQAKINRQVEKALKQAKVAQDEAMKQAKLAQAEASKVNRAEIQSQLRQAQEELKATQKQLEKAQEQLKIQQMQIQQHRKQSSPIPHVPPAPPQPASPSPDEVIPPAPPHASPQSPPIPPSADKLPSPPPPVSPAPPPAQD